MSQLGLIKKYLAFICGVIVSFIIMFLIYSYLLIGQLSDQAKDIFKDLGGVRQHVYAAIESLNSKGFSSCSEENLSLMRKHQFNSNDVRDIGFFENDLLICTTGIGQFKKAIKEPVRDYVFNGHEYWFNHQLKTFKEDIQGIAIRKDRYNIIVSLEGILDEHVRFQNYQLVVKGNGKLIHLYGKPDIFNQNYASDTRHFSRGLMSHSVQFCGPREGVCVAIKHKNLSEFQLTPLLLILILVGMFSGGSFLHTYEMINRYVYSTRRRIKVGLIKDIKANYQAIVGLKSGKVIGCELLARFEDKISPLYPDEFIPIVSELDMSWEMTEHLILQAVEDFKDIKLGDTRFYISINVFPRDINNGNILKGIMLLKDISPNIQICFEVTEDEELHFSKVGNTLEALSKCAIKISIDDFGTGYSNLSQLKLLDINTLKIDKSFVDEVETGSIRSTLIPNIVSIADKLGANIIAEGIENKLQVKELLKMNIEFGQGWHYSKALPLKEFKHYLINNSDYTFDE